MALPTKPPFQPQFNYPNNKLYQMEVMPVQLNCTFTVASSDSGGLGITGLTGGGIANVFMHTSATPGAGNYGLTNPNPAAGIILVQLQNQFAKLINVHCALRAPVTGSALTSVTTGNVYTLQSVGTTTAAQWQAKGLPVGLTPAVGQSFVAKATGALGGTGTVKIAGVTGITSVELAAQESLNLVNSNVYQNGGAQITLQTLAPTVSTGAYVSPMIPTAPADGTVVRLSLLLSNSSVNVQGQ